MRILYCNKYNYPFSGTEVYLFELMELMRAQGHEVALFSMADPRGEATPYDRHFVPHIDFKEKSRWWQKARRAGHAIYSMDARRRIRAMIEEFRPDVAHVRNIYHHLSPSILWELKAQHVPVSVSPQRFQAAVPELQPGVAGASVRGVQGRQVLACAEGEVLSGDGRAHDVGGRSLRSSLAGHISKSAWTCSWPPAGSCATSSWSTDGMAASLKCCRIFREIQQLRESNRR